MPYWLTETHSINVLCCKQSDLIVKINKSFNDNSTGARTTPILGILPSSIDIVTCFYRALTFTRRTHYRLYNTRNSNGFYCCLIFIISCCETIRRRSNSELFCYQPSYAFAIHSELCCASGWDHVEAFTLKFDQCVRCNSLYLRNNEVRFF